MSGGTASKEEVRSTTKDTKITKESTKKKEKGFTGAARPLAK
jgi:hypothetical protein